LPVEPFRPVKSSHCDWGFSTADTLTSVRNE
jgi:hypothetical protein